MRQYEISVLSSPVSTTAAGSTGSYVDLQGYINMGGREIKLVLLAGAGTTAGTCGGTVQSAQDTSGTGLATLQAFTGLTSAGGSEVAHAVVPASHRYVRFLGTVQSGKDMILTCFIQGKARVSP